MLNLDPQPELGQHCLVSSSTEEQVQAKLQKLSLLLIRTHEYSLFSWRKGLQAIIESLMALVFHHHWLRASSQCWLMQVLSQREPRKPT